MLQVELKKILFHHKGLLLLLIALAAYAVFCVGSGYDSSYVIDRNEDTYLTYMERWQGEITEEKAQEMEAEYAEATRSDDGRKAAFLTIYNQYYYAKEDPAHRFLMDERGWDTLLTRDGVNVILLLFLLALCVPVFCGEYQCGMAQILRSCRNGRGRLAGIKLCVMAALAVLATVLFQLVQFVVVALSVGLDGASYPLQSLSFFEHSPYLISVGQAYGIVVLSRCLGAAWFAILIALLSILFRQTVLTTFSGIAVSILPHLIGGSFLKYVLPLPAGLLAGTGYVWGTLTEVGYDEDWNLIDIVTFPGITPEQFGFLIVLFLAIVCLLVWLCLRFYVGRRKAISARPLLTAVLILCMTVSLTGCGHSNSSEITHDFLADASKGENRAYTVELDMVENTITATSKATGEAKAYSGKPITDAQRESYARYKANEKEIAQTVAEVITDYVNTNCNELAETWMGARMVSSVSDLADIVTPKTLLFTQTGDALLLLDCAWDIEHGLGVQIFPEYKIGSQDCFL